MAQKREEFLTVEEAAEMLKVAPKTVREWCRLGKLKAKKYGKSWRIKPSAIEEGGVAPTISQAEIEAAGQLRFEV